MQWPRQSFGESNTQPSTPCSASGECGGRRSLLTTSAVLALRRRVRFKSGAAPALSETESIMANQTKRNSARPGNRELLELSDSFLTSTKADPAQIKCLCFSGLTCGNLKVR